MKDAKYIPPNMTDMIEAMEALIKLHIKNSQLVNKTGKASRTINKVFRHLECCPIIDIKKTSAELNLSFNAVSNAVNKLIESGILIQTENVRRSRVFAYEEYLRILRKDT